LQSAALSPCGSPRPTLSVVAWYVVEGSILTQEAFVKELSILLHLWYALEI